MTTTTGETITTDEAHTFFISIYSDKIRSLREIHEAEEPLSNYVTMDGMFLYEESFTVDPAKLSNDAREAFAEGFYEVSPYDDRDNPAPWGFPWRHGAEFLRDMTQREPYEMGREYARKCEKEMIELRKQEEEFME